jgi:uncharacterized membrane protein
MMDMDGGVDGATGDPVRAAPTRLTRGAIAILSLAACGVAGYLLYLSLAERGLPAGCGSGSGCEEVLSSRWSQLFGVPVSAGGVAVYVGILAALPFVGPRNSPARIGAAWSALILSAVVVAASAIWFVGLQLVVIRAVCPWCMGEHVLGLAIAALILRTATTGWNRSSSDASHPRGVVRRARILRVAVTGIGLVGLLALGQTFAEYHPPGVQRLPPGRNADTGPGPQRRLSVLDGEFTFAAHDVPALGSPDSPKVVLVLFDYCCPHCRATHAYLLNGLAAHKDELGILLLPTPLNSQCNPYWEHTESRFEHSCELARLALAVWRGDRSKFPGFDAWLFEPEKPREPDAARRFAEELVPAAALDKALADPWIGRLIEQNVNAFHTSHAERVPVILSPGMSTIVGRPESEEQLFAILEKELGLKRPR